MKQLITRIDASLHERLKAKAHAAGRSVNDLVTELIEREVGQISAQEAFRNRLMAAGLLVVTPKPRGKGPTLDEVLAENRGSGAALTEALEDDRNHR